MIQKISHSQYIKELDDMKNKIIKLQHDKKQLKKKLYISPGGRTKEYKSKITQHMILEFLHQGKQYFDIGHEDEEYSITNFCLKDFRNRVCRNINEDIGDK